MTSLPIETFNQDESMTDHFTCPICVEYMEHKIILCSNGHSICHKCALQLRNCPFCAMKLNINQRNLTLEKAARRFGKWRAGKRDVAEKNNTVMVPAKKCRLSLGETPSQTRPTRRDHLVCPISKCCYFTNTLLNLKVHIHTWHTEKIHKIKSRDLTTSEKIMYIRLYWKTVCPFSMHMLTNSHTLFLIYISTKDYSLQNPLYYVNVVIISDKSRMYKFSCGSKSQFCSFYNHEGGRPEDGLLIGRNDVAELGVSKVLAKIFITEVAKLGESDEAKVLSAGYVNNA